MGLSQKICAVYTRKSTQDGLDQEFNSLDAQRELCEAYIKSQQQEGWVICDRQYDDGGYTGANIDRPGLNQLLEDISDGLINTVVVYKIDRLSRSLSDFSKLIAIFDKYKISFVSITQDFNTATPMSRLALNVLLSFSQFEREIIGERIRDKFSASKRKGIWTGGVVPLGYFLQGKKLVPCAKQEKIIRNIYNGYLELGSVSKLKRKLDSEKDIVLYATSEGQRSVEYSRGRLYKILKNPVYIGRVVYLGKEYEGQHVSIVCKEVWEAVQKKLFSQTASLKKKEKNSDPLRGKIFDVHGVPYSPSYTKKNGLKYRYYLHQNALQYKEIHETVTSRFPGPVFEDFISQKISEWLTSPRIIKGLGGVYGSDRCETISYRIRKNYSKQLALLSIRKVVVDKSDLRISIDQVQLSEGLSKWCDIELGTMALNEFEFSIPYKVIRSRNGTVEIVAPRSGANDIFCSLNGNIEMHIESYILRDMHFDGKPIEQIAIDNSMSPKTVLKLINSTFLFRSNA